MAYAFATYSETMWELQRMRFTTLTVRGMQRKSKVRGESLQNQGPKVWARTRCVRSENKGNIERDRLSKGSEEGLDMPYWADQCVSEYRHLQWGVVVMESGWHLNVKCRGLFRMMCCDGTHFSLWSHCIFTSCFVGRGIIIRTWTLAMWG